MDIKWLSHSNFAIEDKIRILIDPWISQLAKIKLEDLIEYKPDLILITHGHPDHGVNEAIEIARKTNSTIVGIVELAQYISQKGVKSIGLNIGGSFSYKDINIHVTPAIHTCPYAVPAGYVIEGNKVIYHAGDTSVTKEFEIISEMFNIDISLLPIGGTYTMSYKHMPIVKKYLKSKKYIGMHYDSFPSIKIDRQEASKYIELIEISNLEL